MSGSVDVARALKEGEQALEPGLLAEANRGILYVDEINLLDDHLTDVLLDAAALGVNVVEREGVSVSHPARFLLVGTMNEEEGELRPQIADRIGLEVEVEALDDPAARAEVIRRRGAFAADAEAFRAEWASAQAELAAAIAAAEERLVERARAGRALRRGRARRARLGRAEPPRGHRDRRVRAGGCCAGRPRRGELDDMLAAAALALGHRIDADPFAPAAEVDTYVLQRLLEDALEIEVSRKKVEDRATS